MDSVELDAIADCRAGTLSAFDVLYTRHVDAVYRYLYRRTCNKDIAQDLTSTTFLKAMESIRSFHPSKGMLRAWLYRIARNTLIDHYRTFHATQDIASVWDLPGDDVASVATERKLDVAKLHAALATLSADQREVVMLRVWEDLSHADIAALTDRTEANSKVLFSRAIASLRTQLSSLSLFILFSRFL